jgi:hypothetical protein
MSSRQFAWQRGMHVDNTLWKVRKKLHGEQAHKSGEHHNVWLKYLNRQSELRIEFTSAGIGGVHYVTCNVVLSSALQCKCMVVIGNYANNLCVQSLRLEPFPDANTTSRVVTSVAPCCDRW